MPAHSATKSYFWWHGALLRKPIRIDRLHAWRFELKFHKIVIYLLYSKCFVNFAESCCCCWQWCWWWWWWWWRQQSKIQHIVAACDVAVAVLNITFGLLVKRMDKVCRLLLLICHNICLNSLQDSKEFIANWMTDWLAGTCIRRTHMYGNLLFSIRICYICFAAHLVN